MLGSQTSDGRARRPALMVLVYGVFLVLVGVTAAALVALASVHVSTAMLNTAVAEDRGLVELFINRALEAGDLEEDGPTASRRAELDQSLDALVGEGEILRIDVHATNGAAIASSAGAPGRAEASGSTDAPMDTATAELVPDAPAKVGLGAAARGVVREYLPLRTTTGETVAIVTLWRDAAPVMARIEAAQRDIALVTLAAAVFLAVVLFLLFRGAQHRISRQQASLIEAERRDPLSGLLNHGALVGQLTNHLETARGAAGSVAIALIDVDNFRLFNETHGHAAGDQVLLRVAQHLRNSLDEGDVLGRYGPDEFLMVRSGSDQDRMAGDLERICAELRGASVQFDGSEELPITVSAGVAVFPRHADSVTELLSSVAGAVGEARSSGGDVVRVAPLGPEDHSVSGSFDVLSGLVIAVDTKDRYTKRHSEDVARYAVFLARRVGLDEEALEIIRLAGLLHDVGKIGIPDTLLRKPGRLEADEFDIFKQHVALGDAIVRDIPNVERVREGIRFHHERWDGRGYLEGREGDGIPLIGRVLAVADAFSAMTTTRPYRKALDIQESLKRLGDAAGTQLEERLVASFIEGIETDADAPLPGDDQAGHLWRPLERVA